MFHPIKIMIRSVTNSWRQFKVSQSTYVLMPERFSFLLARLGRVQWNILSTELFWLFAYQTEDTKKVYLG